MHRLVTPGPLLGNAVAQSGGPNPGHGLDPACDGGISIGPDLGRRTHRSGGVVSGYDVDRFRYFQYPRLLPRRGAHTGAGRGYLIFRVAVPAALPNIFIGLFMGLGASFLTLVVAETVGVKSGLGWYLSWAQGWAEYGKVYATLVIMAAFFSTIMTALFKVRDRMLVWQKGVIKW